MSYLDGSHSEDWHTDELTDALVLELLIAYTPEPLYNTMTWNQKEIQCVR